MKRPLTVFGFAMLFSLLVMGSVSNGFALVTVSAVSFVLFVFSLIFRKIRQASVIPTVFLGVAVACLLMFISDVSCNNALRYKGDNLEVSGTVCENPEFNREKGRYYCVIKLDSIEGKNVGGKLRMSFSEAKDEISHESLKIGDRVDFTATVYETGENNESTKRYFRSQGINLGAYKIRDEKIKKPVIRGIYYYAAVLRAKATDIILRHFSGDTAGLMIAVLTGDKSYISDEFYAFSRYSGVAHLMAVSGLHLSIWVFVVGYILDIRGKKSKTPYLVMLLCVIFMMNFAGLSGSVKRAGAMTLLYLFGKLIGKNADALNSLGFALTAILFCNPYAVYDVGFMLSLFSTFGILVMAFPLSNKLLKQKETILEGTVKLKVMKAVTESVLVSLSVALFTLPVTTYYFGYISSVSALTNLLIFPVSMPLVVGTGLFTLTSSLPFISTTLGLFCRYTSELVVAIVSFMGSLSFAKIHLDYNFLFPFLIFAGFCLFLIAMVKSKRFKQVTAIALVLIFTVQFTTEYVLHLTTYRINHFSDSCYIVTVRDKGVIVGLSGDYYIYENILDHIERTGVKIEAVLPDENAEYLNLNYAEHELFARIIEGDCKISLYGVVDIIKDNGKVAVTDKY